MVIEIRNESGYCFLFQNMYADSSPFSISKPSAFLPQPLLPPPSPAFIGLFNFKSICIMEPSLAIEKGYISIEQG